MEPEVHQEEKKIIIINEMQEKGIHEKTTHNEKDQLQHLNERFARLIEQLHQPEREDVDGPHHDVTFRIREYEDKLSDLRNEMKTLYEEKSHLKVELNSLQTSLQEKKEVEKKLAKLRAEWKRLTVEHEVQKSYVETLAKENEFIRTNYIQVIGEMQKKWIKTGNSTQMDLSLAEMLEQIRLQYMKIAERYQIETEKWYNNRMSVLRKEVDQKTEEMRKFQQQIMEYNVKNQKSDFEIESLKSTIESMKRQMMKMEEMYKSRESMSLHSSSYTSKLESEIKRLNAMMQLHDNCPVLRRNHMDLETEIITYETLLDNGEYRVKAGEQFMIDEPGRNCHAHHCHACGQKKVVNVKVYEEYEVQHIEFNNPDDESNADQENKD